MTNQERRDAHLAYIADGPIFEELAKTRGLVQKLNTIDRTDGEGILKIIQELLQTEQSPCIVPPFYCDYGSHISVGKNFFANYNCTLLDVGRITFGDNCMLAPNVAIYTAGHPLHPDSRNSGYEYGADVVIGSNVWIGGSMVIRHQMNIGELVAYYTYFSMLTGPISSLSSLTTTISEGMVSVERLSKLLNAIPEIRE